MIGAAPNFAGGKDSISRLVQLIKNEGLSSFLHGPQIARDKSAIDLGSAQTREISGALDGEAERIGLVSVDMAHVARFPVRHPGSSSRGAVVGMKLIFGFWQNFFQKVKNERDSNTLSSLVLQ